MICQTSHHLASGVLHAGSLITYWITFFSTSHYWETRFQRPIRLSISVTVIDLAPTWLEYKQLISVCQSFFNSISTAGKYWFLLSDTYLATWLLLLLLLVIGSAKSWHLSNVLSLEVIKQLDSGKSCRKVAEDFGCGKTQIARCKTERVDILKEWESGSRSDLKYVKKRKTVYDVVNSLTWEWFCKKTFPRY